MQENTNTVAKFLSEKERDVYADIKRAIRVWRAFSVDSKIDLVCVSQPFDGVLYFEVLFCGATEIDNLFFSHFKVDFPHVQVL